MKDVLIIDDDQEILELLKFFLGGLAEKCEFASGLKEARAKIGPSTRLIVCDFFLKDGTGNLFLRELKDSGSTAMFGYFTAAHPSEIPLYPAPDFLHDKMEGYLWLIEEIRSCR